GNPFFLEETVRTLVETKALGGERGRYQLTQPVQTTQVPATIQAWLAARIDRRLPEDKHLLQTASVIGKNVPFALLQAIAELPDEAVRRGLDHLQAAEFVYEAGLFPDLEYFRGEYERVVELATDNLAALPADWTYEDFGNAAPASVYVRYWLVMSLAQLGR